MFKFRICSNLNSFVLSSGSYDKKQLNKTGKRSYWAGLFRFLDAARQSGAASRANPIRLSLWRGALTPHEPAYVLGQAHFQPAPVFPVSLYSMFLRPLFQYT